MAINRDPKPKKLKPKDVGEKWLLLDGRTVIFLKMLPNGFFSAINEDNFLEQFHINILKEKYEVKRPY